MIHLIGVSKTIIKPYQPTIEVLDSVSVSVDTSKIVALYGDHLGALSALIQLVSGVLRPDGGRIVNDGVRFSPLINADDTAGATQFGMMTLLETIRWHARLSRIDERSLLRLVDQMCDVSKEIHLPIYAIEWPKRRGIETTLVAVGHYDCYLVDRLDQIEDKYQAFLLDACRFRRAGLLFTTNHLSLAQNLSEETIQLSSGALNLKSLSQVSD